MTRNAERDAKEAARRKVQLIQAGFELFSRYGIESVSLSAVADRADVGVATLYKYFQNKANLAVAISGYIWSDVWSKSLEVIPITQMKAKDPCQLFEQYADLMIMLYRDQPQILRFSANYKTFIKREEVPQDNLHEHLDPLEPIGVLFNQSYDAAAQNGLVRTDIPKEEMFSFLAITMLAMAERYAQGIVWTEGPNNDHCEDLIRLKDALITWMKG